MADLFRQLFSTCVLTLNLTTLGPSCDGIIVRAPVIPIELGWKLRTNGLWFPIGIRWGTEDE